MAVAALTYERASGVYSAPQSEEVRYLFSKDEKSRIEEAIEVIRACWSPGNLAQPGVLPALLGGGVSSDFSGRRPLSSRRRPSGLLEIVSEMDDCQRLTRSVWDAIAAWVNTEVMEEGGGRRVAQEVRDSGSENGQSDREFGGGDISCLTT